MVSSVLLSVTECLLCYLSPGTLWNLSSHDSVKMEIVDHAMHALVDEVIVPHSGWERGNNGGEESCKPRHLEWETALTNTAGCLRYERDKWMEIRECQKRRNRLILRDKNIIMCLTLSNRNVSSERSEARRKLRECAGLVDSLMYVVQSQINRKDVDNKVTVYFTQKTLHVKRYILPQLSLHLHI